MNWRDLFYFSQGERRALTLLLCLISISWIILLLTDNKPEQIPKENALIIEPAKPAQTIASNRPEPRRPKHLHPKEKTIPSGRKRNFIREELQTYPEERLSQKQRNIQSEQWSS